MGKITGRVGLWLSNWVIALCICAAVTGIAMSGLVQPLSLSFRDFWFSVFQRPASGEIVVVHLDSRSIQTLESWPWPRSHYGKVVDRLNEAGADMIAFDVDFSSPSKPEEDKAFAAAIERAAGKVLLASHVQPLSADQPELTITLPLDILLENALWGDVNVMPPKGLARVASVARLYSPDEPRPSFAAIIAQNGPMPASEFVIDYSIDRTSLPNLSFVDVLNGKFDPVLVKGKRVVIGATAIELGDRVSVPIWGVIPGVEVNALIAESLMQGRILQDLGLIGQVALILIVVVMMNPNRILWGFRSIALPASLSVAVSVSICVSLFLGAGLLVDPLPSILAVVVCVFASGLIELASRSNAVMRERSTSSMRQAMITRIVEDSSDGILVVKDTGRIELCNDQAARLLNITRKTLTGRPVRNYLPVYDDLPRPTSGEDEATREGELLLESAGGEAVIELHVRRTLLGGLAAADVLGTRHLDTYTLRDVTAVRMARQAELIAQEERLAAERAKSNFVANMSHELRTPLNAIIGFSELLAKEMLGPVEQRVYVEHADIVVKSSHQLLAVVNNVIDVARLDSDAVQVSIAEVSVSDVVDAAVDLVKALSVYKKHDIRVIIAPGASLILTDTRLLRQVAYNLLSNAVKFSPEESVVNLSVWLEGADAVLEVEDRGCGIDEEALPRLSDLFSHAESAFNRQHDGLGVGLYLVKRCLEKLNGRLSFKTAVGEGTKVRVVLPEAAVMPASAIAFAGAAS
jgi:signal transduction histidine kinase/CHASE2 domain-containing sensor protein